MKKIGIYCLASRRPDFYVAHAKQLANCSNKDFHFYLLANNYTQEQIQEIQDTLKDNVSLFKAGPPIISNYMDKIMFGISQKHEYAIKHDEDCFMLSESWDRLFALADQMDENDLCATGVISNGIPTCDLFLEHHTPEIKDELFNDFCNIKLAGKGDGADYSSLDENYAKWDPQHFFNKVKNFNHHYKGIHPVRVSLDAVKKINKYIVDNFKQVMTPKNTGIIKDNTKYPYFCNGVKLIRSSEWKTIVEDKTLYVDGFDEVPLNKYRDKTKKNLVIDTGIPIIHTMYNWTPDWNYEFALIKEICKKADELL